MLLLAGALESVEARILVAIHRAAGPTFDVIFVVSHVLASQEFLVTLVLSIAAVHAMRRERREAAAWIAIGVATVAWIVGLKDVIVRPRPDLWSPLVTQGGSSFPSGHAVASASFYPLLAWILTRRRRRLRPLALSLAVVLAFVIGLGRLYLGLHWPTDVLAGWLIGAAQCSLAVAWLERVDEPPRGEETPSLTGPAGRAL
jgi:undecaprenyl-diphosphatase